MYTIPELTSLLAQTHTSIGTAGELVIARALQTQGYSVQINHKKGDLEVISPDGEILYLEIKTAQRASDHRFHFTLFKQTANRIKTDHRKADFVILLCITRSGCGIPFVIPCAWLKDRRALAVGTNPHRYKGQLAPFKQSLRSLSLEGEL